jgi:hypothetical protein
VVAEDADDSTLYPSDDEQPLSTLRGISRHQSTATKVVGSKLMLKTTATKKGGPRQKPKADVSATKPKKTDAGKPNEKTPTTSKEPSNCSTLPSTGTVFNLSRQNAKETFGFKASDGAPGDKVFVQMVTLGGIADAAGLKVGMQIVSADGTAVKFRKKNETNLGSIISKKLVLTLTLLSPNPPPKASLSLYHCPMHGTELPDWEPFEKTYLDAYVAPGKILSSAVCCGRPTAKDATKPLATTDFHGNCLPPFPKRAVCGRRGLGWSTLKNVKHDGTCFWTCRQCNKTLMEMSDEDKEKVAVLCWVCHEDFVLR